MPQVEPTIVRPDCISDSLSTSPVANQESDIAVILWNHQEMFREWLRNEQRTEGFEFILQPNGNNNIVDIYVCGYPSTGISEGCPCKLVAWVLNEPQGTRTVGFYRYVHSHKTAKTPSRGCSVSSKRSEIASDESSLVNGDFDQSEAECKASEEMGDVKLGIDRPPTANEVELVEFESHQCRFPISYVRTRMVEPEVLNKKINTTSAQCPLWR